MSVVMLPLTEDEAFVLGHVKDTAINCGHFLSDDALRRIINTALVATRNRQDYRSVLAAQRAALDAQRKVSRPLRPEEV